MAIRVKIRLKFQGKEIETVALANSGYETQAPEVSIPKHLAIKHWNKALMRAYDEVYISLSGPFAMKHMGSGKITLLAEGSRRRYVEAKIVVSEYEKETLLNDKLIGALKLNLLDAAKGEWRFTDDKPSTKRPSA